MKLVQVPDRQPKGRRAGPVGFRRIGLEVGEKELALAVGTKDERRVSRDLAREPVPVAAQDASGLLAGRIVENASRFDGQIDPAIEMRQDDAVAAKASDMQARVHSAWAPFRAAIAAMKDALDEPTGSGWTAKEMLAHVAFWDEAVVPVVVSMFRGEDLPAGWAFGTGDLGLVEEPWPDADVHNAREATWARRRSATEVIERCDRAHSQLEALLATVTDDEFVSHLEFFLDLGRHYVEHLQELGRGAR